MQASFPVAEARGRSTGIFAAVVLAAGFLVSSAVLGGFFYGARQTAGQVRVVGAATVPFESDIVKWRVQLMRQVGTAGLGSGYAEIRTDVDGVVERLVAAGIDPQAVTIQPSGSSPVWSRDGEGVTAYQLRQGFVVVSDALDAVEGMALNPGNLLAEGVVLESSQLEYFYDDLPALKHSLLAEATDDARARAEEIAGRSGSELGRMVSGQAGVFQITEPYSTEVAGYGRYDTATRSKQMTVTVHATFEIR